MPNIYQVTTVTSGFTGAPGYTNHFFDASSASLAGAQAASNAVRTFWETAAAAFCSTWRYSINADVNELVDSTGALVGVFGTTPGAQSTFGDSGAYAAGVGACASFVTNAVHREHRLRGRTFFVPLAGSSYDTDGTIGSVAISRLRNAANGLVAAGGFGIWGRPVGGVNGLWSAAIAANVKDQTSTLRSRRR